MGISKKQQEVLELLKDSKEGILQSRLGEILNISTSAFSQRISTMEKNGLIEKISKPNPETGKIGNFIIINEGLIENPKPKKPKPISDPKPKKPKPISAPKPKILNQSAAAKKIDRELQAIQDSIRIEQGKLLTQINSGLPSDTPEHLKIKSSDIKDLNKSIFETQDNTAPCPSLPKDDQLREFIIDALKDVKNAIQTEKDWKGGVGKMQKVLREIARKAGMHEKSTSIKSKLLKDMAQDFQEKLLELMNDDPVDPRLEDSEIKLPIDEPMELKGKGSKLQAIAMDDESLTAKSKIKTISGIEDKTILPTLKGNGGTKVNEPERPRFPYKSVDHYIEKGEIADHFFDKLQYDVESLHDNSVKRRGIIATLQRKFGFVYYELKREDGIITDNGYQSSLKFEEENRFHVKFSYNKKLKKMLFRFTFDEVIHHTRMIPLIEDFLFGKLGLKKKNWNSPQISKDSEESLEIKKNEGLKQNFLSYINESDRYQVLHQVALDKLHQQKSKQYFKPDGSLRIEANLSEVLEGIVKGKRDYQPKEIIDTLQKLAVPDILNRIETRVNSNGSCLVQVQESLDLGFQDLTGRSRNFTNILVNGLETVTTSFNDVTFLFEDILNKNNGVMQDLNKSFSNPAKKWLELWQIYQAFPNKEKTPTLFTLIKKNYHFLEE